MCALSPHFKDTSETPRTLIFRYLALYSISRYYLCGHFVLSKTEHSVFSTLIKGPNIATRRGKVILPRPVRDSEQRRAPAAKSLRQRIHSMDQRTLPATTNARHSINARKPRWIVLRVALRGCGWGCLGICTQCKSDRCQGTNAGEGIDTTEE